MSWLLWGSTTQFLKSLKNWKKLRSKTITSNPVTCIQMWISIQESFIAHWASRWICSPLCLQLDVFRDGLHNGKKCARRANQLAVRVKFIPEHRSDLILRWINAKHL